jgi:enterochelin esterase family protein
LVLSSNIFSQPFSEFANYVHALETTEEKQEAVDSFMNANPTLPYIHENVATFIIQSNVTVRIIGDFNNWSQNGTVMTQIQNTDLNYFTQTFEYDARIGYLYLKNGVPSTDENNPYEEFGFTVEMTVSVLFMPNYDWPWEMESYPNVPKGELIYDTLHNSYNDQDYNIYIYTPYGYDKNDSTLYPTIYFNDGDYYLEEGFETNRLDNLIHFKSLKKFIGVFIKPNERKKEYFGPFPIEQANYKNFVVNEVVKHIDSAYKTEKKSESRIMVGGSAGGNIAIQIGYENDDLFGNIALQAAWFGLYGEEPSYSLVMNGPKKDIKWSSAIGTYDYPFLYNLNVKFRDTLIAKGYDYCWKEFHVGHSLGILESSFDDILMCFDALVNSEDSILIKLKVDEISLYPNPTSGIFRLPLSFPIELINKIIAWDTFGFKHNVMKLSEREYQLLGNIGIYHVIFEMKNEKIFVGKVVLIR